MRQHHKNKQPLHRRTIKTARLWVVAGAHNNFHPKVLRPIGLVCFALILALIPSFYNYVSAGRMQVLGYATSISVGELYSLGNTERTNAGLGTLNLNGTLSQAAYNKAQDMIANNYWAHTSPSGKTPWTFISGAGYAYTTAGENLAKNFSSSAGVMYGWMNSPTHRANVLGSQYQDVGYAVVNGVLQGEETTLVVAMYAAPYVAPATPPAPAASTQAAPPAAPQAGAAKASAPQTITAPTAQQNTPQTTPPAQEVATPPSTQKADPQTKPAQNQTKAAAISTSQSIAQDAKGASSLAPFAPYASLNWGQKTSLFVLSVLLLLFIMKHTAIWRSRKRGLRAIWLRAHPLAQGGVLMLAIVVTFLSGTGSIL